MRLDETTRATSSAVLLRSATWGARWVRWGETWEHGTPAYWVEATRRSMHASESSSRHQLTDSLPHEVALCILGGYGMPYEIGLAAFDAVREQLLKHDPTPSAEQIEQVLRQPLEIDGHMRRYRFPHQRASRLSGALRYVHSRRGPADPLATREWLAEAPGIGLKTASWIVRNRWPHSPIAILDVHVLRAGKRAGIFPEESRPARCYRELEELFLAWATAGGIAAADLDATIWAEQAYRSRHRF